MNTSMGTDPDIKHEAPLNIVQWRRLFKIGRLKPRIYVPLILREKVIYLCHDSPFAGHGGIVTTEPR
jgi:hypothetical protein